MKTILRTQIEINLTNLKYDLEDSNQLVSKFDHIQKYVPSTGELEIVFQDTYDETPLSLDETELDLILTNHDSTHDSLSLEDMYSKREIDGVNYYRTVQVQLAKNYFDGNTDFATTRTIETKLEKVVALLVRGNWLSAKDEIENNVVTDDADLTIELRDSILSGINEYITNNY